MSRFDKKLIVVIDDDEDDCYLVELSVKKTFPDYEVLAITDSFQALAQLRALQHIPSLIVLDMYMPLSGENILAQLRELPQYDSVPIVVLSSVLDPNTVVGLNHMGAACVVEKSSDFDRTANMLTKMLS